MQTIRATRAASMDVRSGCGTMSRRRSPPSADDRPPKVIGQMPPSSSGIATIIVASTGSRPRGVVAPLFQRLEFDWMCGDVGHIQPCEQFLGGPSIVVGWTADKAEPGQRHDGIHCCSTVRVK